MSRKEHIFFENKTCEYCKKNAKIFRQHEGQSYYLCGSYECEKQFKLRMGLFKSSIKGLEKLEGR